MSTPHDPLDPGLTGLEPLSTAELQQIDAVLAAARSGEERGWFDPATGALQGRRPVDDDADDLASVTAIRRHGGRW